MIQGFRKVKLFYEKLLKLLKDSEKCSNNRLFQTLTPNQRLLEKWINVINITVLLLGFCKMISSTLSC